MDHPNTAWLPRHFKFWPEDTPVQVNTADLISMYNAGYAGCWIDEAGDEEFAKWIASQPFGIGSGDEAKQLHGSGADRLVIPFAYVEGLLPGCWPGAAQQRGDCVSHSTKNAALVTMICDIVSGKPDEESGIIEGLPTIDPTGIAQGALSSEANYWWRGYNGDGWQCSISARVACQSGGMWLRNNYPDLNIDLRRYSGSLAGRYGRTPPPRPIADYGRKYNFRTATQLRGFEQIRDFLANGYGVSSCGGEGYSRQRDANGYSRRSGSWAHAMAIIGVDDRPVIKRRYGEPLVLILNSWGRWNSGGRRILETNIDIPEGSFWTRWSEANRRSYFALSGARGWPAKTLPPVDLLVG